MQSLTCMPRVMLKGKDKCGLTFNLWRQNNQDSVWCIGGDFNVVRNAGERRGIRMGNTQGRKEMEDFNSFINHVELLDISSRGRRFTWFRPNDTSMSRLDRFLLSHEWLSCWPDCTQLVLERTFSDHCPILLKYSTQNWGPKPFRSLNCWFEDRRFKGFVEKTWSELNVQGWGAFVLK